MCFLQSKELQNCSNNKNTQIKCLFTNPIFEKTKHGSMFYLLFHLTILKISLIWDTILYSVVHLAMYLQKLFYDRSTNSTAFCAMQ